MRQPAFIALFILASAAPAAAADRSPYVIPDWQSACGVHGADFRAVGNGDTCIRLGGKVAASAGVAASRGQRVATGTGVMGQVEADVRTQTELGPLRGFVRLRAGADTASGTSAYDKAFIQFGH